MAGWEQRGIEKEKKKEEEDRRYKELKEQNRKAREYWENLENRQKEGV